MNGFRKSLKMVSFNQMVKNLSHNMPVDVQNKAKAELIRIDESDLVKLVQPMSKDCWENAAEVIKDIGYPRIKIILPQLLEWLQDMNWPGANTISTVLENVDKGVLVPYIEDAIIQAVNEKDYVWLAWIKDLITKCSISEKYFSDKKFITLLDLAEW